MNESYNYINKIVTKVKETEDAFIFRTLCDFSTMHYDVTVEKDELVKAIQLIRMMREHGDDIVDRWNTATQQSEALAHAYIRGVEDGIEKERNRIKDRLGMKGEDR